MRPLWLGKRMLHMAAAMRSPAIETLFADMAWIKLAKGRGALSGEGTIRRILDF